MIHYCIQSIKSHPKLFHWIKDNDFLMWIISYLLQLRFVMTRWWWTLIKEFLCHTFCYYILRSHKDVQIQIKWVHLTMPNHMKALDWAIEVMYDEFYDRLHWHTHVLDLWGYIGESAIRLAQQNGQVTVYEAHPENYRYLQRNIRTYKNIISHNQAVVWWTQREMTFYGGAFNMWAGSEKSGNDAVSMTTVWCIDIVKVLSISI